ncbi:DUF802 domain-containing protein [Xanthomonas albilineans]|uniref:DUF802 domain-containing protein n=1 Tax=Xanthomonas albilineans TaxID=29447 RepID=UPI0005F32CB4|nr:DUF802 domain-containing protein [Xanthomonas albilineans]
MHKTLFHIAVFLAGLVVVCWIGFGYLDSNPLGAGFAALIGVCYLAGVAELYRYRQASATLVQALDDADTARTDLDGWLQRLDPSLRNAVRLRIEGARAGLPVPALTAYLVGLLVLLGMLGTFLGMMATLRGTGLALDSANDLDAIRAALAAPLKGLGFAFGTSIAGVASSAMLGLLAALCRRERLHAVQRLDLLSATALRAHSQAHQRNEALQLLQTQAALMPTLVERLHTMMSALEHHSAASGERLAAHQDAFHRRTEVAYTRLAGAVEHALQTGVDAHARALGEALQPVVQRTLEGVAHESATLQASVGQAVQRQLDALTSGFADTAAHATQRWDTALAEQRRNNSALLQEMASALQRAGDGLEQRATTLVETVSARLQAASDDARQAWGDALARQQVLNDSLAADNAKALDAAASNLEQRTVALAETLRHAHTELQDALEARDQARLSAWTDSFARISTTLGEHWEHNGERIAQRQQDICDTLQTTAATMSAHSQAQARETIAEIARLVQIASEAPKAAADVLAELRQALSDSMVRDTAMLDERNRLLATLHTLLDAVNHASTEQRSAVDALVATSADLLERVGSRFSDRIEAESDKLGNAAAQIAASATEVASLGEAFAGAVHAFDASNNALLERLHGIEQALDKSLARSDEQLAYYVAQAREVIDLSMLSQRQITEELRQLAAPHAPDQANVA